MVAPRSIERLLHQGAHGANDTDFPPIARRSTRVRDRQLRATNSYGNGVVLDAPTANPHALPLERQPNQPETLAEPSETDGSETESEGSGTDAEEDASTVEPLLPDDDDEGTDEEDQDAKPCGRTLPITEMRDEFRDYCVNYSDAFLPFTRAQKTSIRLLATLKMKKAPLNTFAEVLEWHLKETNQLANHESLKDSN